MCIFNTFGTIFGVGIKYLNDTMDFVGIISKDLLQKRSILCYDFRFFHYKEC